MKPKKSKSPFADGPAVHLSRQDSQDSDGRSHDEEEPIWVKAYEAETSETPSIDEERLTTRTDSTGDDFEEDDFSGPRVPRNRSLSETARCKGILVHRSCLRSLSESVDVGLAGMEYLNGGGPRKSVHFNDRVVRTVFRPNSSILGQRRKNQKKKLKSKQKRQLSLETIPSEPDVPVVVQTSRRRRCRTASSDSYDSSFDLLAKDMTCMKISPFDQLSDKLDKSVSKDRHSLTDRILSDDSGIQQDSLSPTDTDVLVFPDI